LEKYKKILNDVKLCQEVSRMGKSMMWAIIPIKPQQLSSHKFNALINI
jgi:hypothetical protein